MIVGGVVAAVAPAVAVLVVGLMYVALYAVQILSGFSAPTTWTRRGGSR